MADDIMSVIFGALASATLTDEDRDVVANSEVDGYTIDTQLTIDQGYETAIWFEDDILNMIIVDRYPDRETAVQGHDKWVGVCRDAHPSKLWSVQMDEFESLF